MKHVLIAVAALSASAPALGQSHNTLSSRDEGNSFTLAGGGE